jgi:rare lipoprotein A
MRLPVDAGYRTFALGLSAALAGCGPVSGGDRVAALAVSPVSAAGPAADYPMVLGEPFTVGGELFTPADTLNYDAVGRATVGEGAGVTAAHRTLPLPSYAEVTSLDSGRTILVRLERRGPMTTDGIVGLSPAAVAQLGIGEGAAVRVRRVNPIEAERAELRAGRSVPERMESPKSLIDVLRRKLPGSGAANLRSAAPPVRAAVGSGPQPGGAAIVGAPAATPAAAGASVPASQPAALARALVVQAAAFASRANAERSAKTLGGFVTPAGKLYLVRTGPFPDRARAAAALAKVRAAGYSDARVTTAD